jgi:hypothetical protein
LIQAVVVPIFFMILLVILKQTDAAKQSASNISPQSHILSGVSSCSGACISVMYSPPPLEDRNGLSSGTQLYDNIMRKFASINSKRTNTAPFRIESDIYGTVVTLFFVGTDN